VAVAHDFRWDMELFKEHVLGDDLYGVAFAPTSFFVLNWMAGLVEIHDIIWLPRKQAMFFVVSSKDKSGILFKSGLISGTKIGGFKPSKQSIMVEWPRGHHILGIGGN